MRGHSDRDGRDANQGMTTAASSSSDLIALIVVPSVFQDRDEFLWIFDSESSIELLRLILELAHVAVLIRLPCRVATLNISAPANPSAANSPGRDAVLGDNVCGREDVHDVVELDGESRMGDQPMLDRERAVRGADRHVRIGVVVVGRMTEATRNPMNHHGQPLAVDQEWMYHAVLRVLVVCKCVVGILFECGLSRGVFEALRNAFNEVRINSQLLAQGGGVKIDR
ncbi:hypothetical protein CALCODRAFT_184105 [Calocera cornea HHB12733]|uniref:Uncharacterized protein n=1 Tax=Calocera cornea HHB12733 TaxID=1353952 RepID=A0A165CAE5_9BASI|nr:hypothetical protein CALCODRAFT_184105 [Calocera cornea HHB12733]